MKSDQILQKISLGSEIIWGLILTALASGFLQFPCHLNTRQLNNIIFTIIKEEKIFTLNWDNCDLILESGGRCKRYHKCGISVMFFFNLGGFINVLFVAIKISAGPYGQGELVG